MNNNESQSINELRAELNKRFERNLIFFKKHMPHIYEQFSDYSPKNYGLDLDSNGHLNIACNGQFIFNGDPKKVTSEQVALFLAQPVQSMYLLVPEKRELDNFDYMHLDYLVKVSDAALKYRHLSVFQNKLKRKKFSPVKKHPFFILIGTGLGYHLPQLLQENIEHLYLYEPNNDMFYASLFTVEWQEVFRAFESEGRSITITIGAKVSDFIDSIAKLSQRFGQYNLAKLTIFKHYNSDTADKALQDYIGNISAMYSGYGFCEDEVLSLNHTLANIRKKAKFLLANKVLSENHKYPIFICGSGPSLDDSIDFLKNNKDKGIIVSCGTSLLALNKNGIQSDFHIEVERTVGVHEVLESNPHKNLMSKSILLGMNTLYHKVPEVFEQSILFLKPNDGSTDFIRGAFPPDLAIVYSTNPTVTNGAIGIFNQLKSGDLYLFGCDYGYKSMENHHSKSSGYYDEYDDKWKDLVEKSEDKIVEGNFCDSVYTTTVFSWARLAAEYSIRNNIAKDENKKVYNCSDGAKVEGAIPLNINDIILDVVIDKESFKKEVINNTSENILNESDWKKELIERCEHMFNTIDRLIDDKYKVDDIDPIDVSIIFNRMFKIIRECEGTKYIFTARMLEGSFTYMASTILGHMYAIANEESRKKYINEVMPYIYEYFLNLKSIMDEKVLTFKEID